MKVALADLISNVPSTRKNHLEKEFQGFSVLFKRYLEEAASEIKWDKIELVEEEVNVFLNHNLVRFRFLR